MKTLFNRVLILLHAIVAGFICRNRTPSGSRNVLIIFQQILGDAVILSASLEMYTRLFPRSEGWTVRMICRPSVAHFFREVLFVPEELLLEEVDFTRLVADYSYFRTIIKQYGTDISLSIVPSSTLSAELLSAALPAAQRVGMLSAVSRQWPPHLVLLQKVAYTHPVQPAKELMMLQRHRLLLNELKTNDYLARLPKLKPQKRCVQIEHYCVVCPGASDRAKQWPWERFVQLIDCLTEKYRLEVYLCGGAEEKSIGEMIMKTVCHPELVMSTIGETTFSEWSALVQYADIVVGNDSATLHLAAAGRVPSVCIVGVYDKGLFFPYVVEELPVSERLPVTILHDMPCESCRQKAYQIGYRGYQNKVCSSAIHAGGCASCIEAITVEEVLFQLEQILSEQLPIENEVLS